MNAVTRTTHATTQTVNVLVAGIVATLALLAVPSRVAVTASGTTTRFTATAGATGSVTLSAPPRRSPAQAAITRFTPHVPPALPAATALVAAFACFGLVLLVVRRLRGVTAFRLPGVRGPPPRLASLAI